MSDDIIKRCFILKDMYYITSIKTDIEEIEALKKQKKLKDKQLVKNYDQIKIVGEILQIVNLDMNSLKEHVQGRNMDTYSDNSSPMRNGSILSVHD